MFTPFVFFRIDDENDKDLGGDNELKDGVNGETDENLKSELQPLLGNKSLKSLPVNDYSTIDRRNSITSVNITIANPTIENTNIPNVHYNSIMANGDDSIPAPLIFDDLTPTWMSPELLAYKHNLNFPDSANATPTVQQKIIKCRR